MLISCIELTKSMQQNMQNFAYLLNMAAVKLRRLLIKMVICRLVYLDEVYELPDGRNGCHWGRPKIDRLPTKKELVSKCAGHTSC